MSDYKEELEKTLLNFFEKERKITKNMEPAEEIKYIKENKKEEEIKKIYDELKKKYNIQ